MPGRFAELLARLRQPGRDPDRARLAAVLELNHALARARDRRGLLQLLLDEAVRLFGAERGFVVLARNEPGTWSVAAARSLDREPVRQPGRKLSSSILEHCLRARAGVFCADAQEGDFGAAQSVADMRLRSVLCTPLLAGDALLGALYLDHRFQSGAFAAGDVPWLEAFADQAALALHLHELLEENRGLAAALAERNRALEATVAAQEQELSTLREDVRREDLAHPYPDIVGRSPALVRSLQLLERVLDAGYPVLIVGESGTGKELIARALHRYGPRSRGPFVPVHVAAISPGLLESELFGHVRGAFTGAERDRKGLLRESHGGVLFLDEVTEMDADVQVKLLRFLEDPVVRPVGGDATSAVDTRVVAATNRDPRQAMAEGRLREDLYYRLAVVTIELPPLRERSGDVPLLVRHVLEQAAAERGTKPRRATPALLEALARRRWPGNLRQLRNEVLRMDAVAASDELGVGLLAPEPATAARDAREVDLAAVERRAIEEALRRTGGNKARAARLLGISRRALYNKLGRG